MDQASTDAIIGTIHRDITEGCGWSVVWMSDDHPWAYTVGAAMRRPRYEYVLASTPPEFAYLTLGRLVEAAQAGVDLSRPDDLAEVMDLAGTYIQLRPVHRSWLESPLFGVAQQYWKRPVVPQTLQVVLADTAGRWPWESGHDLGAPQPELWERRPVSLTSGGWRC